MKLIKFIFTLTVIMSVTLSHAQKVISIEEFEQKGNGYELVIPDDLKANSANLKENKIIYIKQFDKDLGGTIYVSGYVDSENNVKLESVKVPKRNLSRNYGCQDGYRPCADECTNKPTTIGVILCTGYCMINCSENQQ